MPAASSGPTRPRLRRHAGSHRRRCRSCRRRSPLQEGLSKPPPSGCATSPNQEGRGVLPARIAVLRELLARIPMPPFRFLLTSIAFAVTLQALPALAQQEPPAPVLDMTAEQRRAYN